MEFRIQRATYPHGAKHEYGKDVCGICEDDFTPTSVWVWVDVASGMLVCETCLRWVGERAKAEPALGWPTFERYEELLQMYPEPMYGSPDEAEWGEKHEDAWERSQLTY